MQMNAPWKIRGSVQAFVGIVNAIEFDPDVEMLWVGDSFGRLMSFTAQSHTDALSWEVYSSFDASTRPIFRVFFMKMGGETVGMVADHNVIRGYKRGGAHCLYCPLPPQSQNHIELFEANGDMGVVSIVGDVGLTRMSIADGIVGNPVTVPLMEGQVVALKQTSKWVITGATSGGIVVRDEKGLQVVGSVPPSRNRVLAMDADDETIIASVVERNVTSSVRVYDVRKMSEPLSVISGIPSDNVSQVCRYRDPFRVLPDRAFVLTSRGFHVIQMDQTKPVYSSTGLLDEPCTCVSVSPNGMCAAVGTDKGHFVALGHPATREDYVMSQFVQPKRPTNPVFTACWEDKEGDTFAFFDESVPVVELASSWPPDNYMILHVAPPMCCVNGESWTYEPNRWGLRRSDSYLPDPRDKLAPLLPNPYPYNLKLGNDPAAVQHVLLELNKDKKRRQNTFREGVADNYAPQDAANLVCYGSHQRFEWEKYNKIPKTVVGLDNSFPECWITTLLQSLYLCHSREFPIRKVIVRHLCAKEYCICCEVAFVFSNMMTTAAAGLNPIVQVSNLIRTLCRIPSAAPLFEPITSRDEAVKRMHMAQLVLLEALHRGLQDEKEYPFTHHKQPSADFEKSIATLFGTEFSSGGKVYVEPRFYWDVPASAVKVNEGLQHLLKQLEEHKSHAQIKRLPPIIVLRLNPEGGTLKPPRCLRISRDAKEDSNYLLCSNIIHLSDDASDPGNFVSHQRVEDERFCLVNDYLVTNPADEQKLELTMPALRSHRAVVSFYALDKLAAPSYSTGDGELPPNMFETLGPLLINDFLARPLQRHPAAQCFKSPLKSHFDIKPNDLVALDAEYVVLDWSKRRAATDSPSHLPQQRHMALARLSCVLSSAPGDERTIVDDYVHTPEAILDYVTQYSGIHPGDLDPLESSKCLTSLKATYLKLRALVDRSVTFVGHGLHQDFRVCNIAVPPNQIIDTLTLFHRPGGRYLSLRFLAYHVLGERVQEGEHDSVEDARTSLRLYRKYRQLKEGGNFGAVLDKLLATGAETSWYVPEGRESFSSPILGPAAAPVSPPFLDVSRDGASSEATATAAMPAGRDG